jgi:hypothetical protein
VKTLGGWISLMLCTAAWAGPADRQAPAVSTQGAPRGERMQQRMRTMRAVGIAEALDLDTPEALRLDAAMRPFDDRRRPLQKQIHDAMQTLRKAAEGDAQALAQVDGATARVLEARAQMAAIDRDMFATLSQGRTPQQRARLALFLAHFQQEVRSMRPQNFHPGGREDEKD